MRSKRVVWVTFVFLALFGCAEAQEAIHFSPSIIAPIPNEPGFWHRLYVQAGCGYNRLPVSLIKIGEPLVTQVPSAQGRNCIFAYGTELPRMKVFGLKLPRILIQEEYERGPMGGKGAFAQGPPSQNPYGPVHGNYTLLASSHNAALEVIPWEKGRWQLFTGAAFPGKMTVRHHMKGTIVIPEGPDGQIVMPVQDDGSDREKGLAFRVGIRFRFTKWLSPGIGAYARDGVTSMFTATSHFGNFIPNPFNRHHASQ